MMMDAIYHNPSHAAAFGGRSALRKAGNFEKKAVDKFLNSDKVYRKFKRNRTKFKRARIFVTSMSHIFQADLMDIQKLSRANSGYRYILIVVDAFSRYTVAKPLKRKGATQVAEALDDVFQELKEADMLAPRVLLATDLGTDFWNSKVRTVLTKYNVSHYALRAPKKASIAENSGRYLMDRLYKYLYLKGDDRWVDNLKDFVKAKNSRRNRRLDNLTPAEVNYENQSKVYESLYADRYDRKNIAPPLEIGQKVQMAIDTLPFHKSYRGYFKDTVYEIKSRVDYNGIYRYSLVDTTDGVQVSGTYYSEELLPFE
jgi:hypothetical protein